MTIKKWIFSIIQMKAKFIYETLDFNRGEDPLKIMDLGIKRRSIVNYDKDQQAFYWALNNPYTKKDLSEFLGVPYKEIYLIVDQSEPDFNEIFAYLDKIQRESGTGNVSHQSFDLKFTPLGKVIEGIDLVEGSNRHTIWGDLKTYMNFKKKFN